MRIGLIARIESVRSSGRLTDWEGQDSSPPRIALKQ